MKKNIFPRYLAMGGIALALSLLSIFAILLLYKTELFSYVVAIFHSAHQSPFTVLLLLSLVSLFLALLFFILHTLQLKRHLRTITAIIRQYHKGDFSQHFPTSSFKEFAQLAEEWNAMRSSLSITKESHNHFIANVSHELKTPINSIYGFIEGILDGTIPEEQSKKYLQIVSTEIVRLTHLIQVMLNLSKMEAGHQPIQPISCDPIQIITQIVESFEDKIKRKKITLTGLKLKSNVNFSLLADPDLLYQALHNLIENAVKFTNEGGVIQFRFSSDPQKLTIRIRNTGNGLTKAEKLRIFDRFYKTDPSRSVDQRGIGLGLNIVKTIVQIHQGKISVQSVPREYTEFSVTLLHSLDPAPTA